MVMRRAAYVAALRRERAAIAARPGDHTLRLAELDRELDRFADEPALDGPVETAVPGPISRSRRRNPRRGREVHRDSGTGEFVTDEFEAEHPDTTETEQV